MTGVDQAHAEAGPVVDLTGRWLALTALVMLAVWCTVVCARAATHRRTRAARDRRWAARHRIDYQ